MSIYGNSCLITSILLPPRALGNRGHGDVHLFEKANRGSATGAITVDGWHEYFTHALIEKEKNKPGSGTKWLSDLMTAIQVI